MKEPEIVKVDGFELAIPPNHPGFEKSSETKQWIYVAPSTVHPFYTRFPIIYLKGSCRRACAAEGYSFWTIWGYSTFGLVSKGYHFALPYARWGGLLELVEGA